MGATVMKTAVAVSLKKVGDDLKQEKRPGLTQILFMKIVLVVKKKGMLFISWFYEISCHISG